MDREHENDVSRGRLIAGVGLAAAAFRPASAAWTAQQPGELSGIYVQLADNQGSFSTGRVYGSAGGSGQP